MEKVAILGQTGFGGMERACTDLHKALKNEGIRAQLFTLKDMPLSISRILGKFQIMHVHLFSWWPLFLLSKFFKKSKVIYTCHGILKPEMVPKFNGKIYSYLAREITGFFARGADINIADSNFIKNKVEERYKITVDKVIPNAVFPERFDVNIDRFIEREKLGLKGKRVILSVPGRFNYGKGVHLLMDSFRLIKDNDARLVVVGGGGNYCEVVKRKADNRVIFKHKISDEELIKLYKISDVFVLPSLEENFGIVLLEAMINELPVVANNSGGVPEIVLDGKTGYLCEPGNVIDMRDNITRLLFDENNAKKFGERGRSRVLKYFTWDKVAKEVIRTYEM